MGCAMHIYEYPSWCKTWAEHTVDVLYLGNSIEHYCRQHIFIKKAQTEQVSDSIYFKHKYILQPVVTPADKITKALNTAKAVLTRKPIAAAAQTALDVLKQAQTGLKSSIENTDNIKQTQFNEQPAPRVKNDED